LAGVAAVDLHAEIEKFLDYRSLQNVVERCGLLLTIFAQSARVFHALEMPQCFHDDHRWLMRRTA
jgi:hypothetical protein